jgi:hypothetical protein
LEGLGIHLLVSCLEQPARVSLQPFGFVGLPSGAIGSIDAQVILPES